MRAFVTGGTGFIGGRLIPKLRRRGGEVVALVRNPARAAGLRALECELAVGDLSDRVRLVEQMRACHAVFHVAGMYEIGIPKSERPGMFEANVRGTENTIDAAVEAGVERIVYVSTINTYGNTRGRVVDEDYEWPPGDYVSYYDETKYLAQRAAEERIARGAPVVIVQPGGVYGPGDYSELGAQLERMREGKLRFLASPAWASTRFTWTTSPTESCSRTAAAGSARGTSSAAGSRRCAS